MEEIYNKFNSKDKAGNMISCDSDGHLHLFLESSSRERNIGRLEKRKKDGRTRYAKDVSEKNIFRNTNSWGLNWYIISQLDDSDWVVLYTKTKKYGLQIKDIKEKGSFLYFKDKGIEKQFFVPLDQWKVMNI